MIINNGPMGGKIELEENIQYSYDGENWKNFIIYGNRGIDEQGCAEIDYNTGILSIYASGYYEKEVEVKYTQNDQEAWRKEIRHFFVYSKDEQETDEEKEIEQAGGNSNTIYKQNNNIGFYLKLLKNNKIKYCLIGGGGGASTGPSQNSTGGGGGAGGEVVYNQNFLLLNKDNIIKIQVGHGGQGGGGVGAWGYDRNVKNGGNSTFTVYKNETLKNTPLYSITALGGKGAEMCGQPYEQTTADGEGKGGEGIVEQIINNVYHKSSAGGKGGNTAGNTKPQDGEDGTLWPQNNTYYGGGGGGGDVSEDTLGGNGGKGGGGHGSMVGEEKEISGSTSTGEIGYGFYGGGAGGGGASNYGGRTGGNGGCLLYFKNFKKANVIPSLSIIENQSFNPNILGKPCQLWNAPNDIIWYLSKRGNFYNNHEHELILTDTENPQLKVILQSGRRTPYDPQYQTGDIQKVGVSVAFPQPLNLTNYNNLNYQFYFDEKDDKNRNNGFFKTTDQKNRPYDYSNDIKGYIILSKENYLNHYFNNSNANYNTYMHYCLNEIIKDIGTQGENEKYKIDQNYHTIDISNLNGKYYLYFYFYDKQGFLDYDQNSPFTYPYFLTFKHLSLN